MRSSCSKTAYASSQGNFMRLDLKKRQSLSCSQKMEGLRQMGFKMVIEIPIRILADSKDGGICSSDFTQPLSSMGIRALCIQKKSFPVRIHMSSSITSEIIRYFRIQRSPLASHADASITIVRDIVLKANSELEERKHKPRMSHQARCYP